MKEYDEVRYIISSKDLDYLKDMFNWHYLAYKNTLDIMNNLNDKDLCKGVEMVNKQVFKFMDEILEIMEDNINENC